MKQTTKEWKGINPLKPMTKKDFLTLFKHLPLDQKEKDRLDKEYWEMYEKFIEIEVDPLIAWEAVRNIFVLKETQIKEKINYLETLKN